MVTVLVGDNDECSTDLARSIQHGIPIVLLEGSPLCDSILAASKDPTLKLPALHAECIRILKSTKYIVCPNSSEELASLVHLMLTVEFTK